MLFVLKLIFPYKNAEISKCRKIFKHETFTLQSFSMFHLYSLNLNIPVHSLSIFSESEEKQGNEGKIDNFLQFSSKKNEEISIKM